MFDKDRMLLYISIAISLVFIAGFVVVWLKHTSIRKLRDGTEDPRVATNVAYYVCLCLLAVAVFAMLFGAFHDVPTKFYAFELPLLTVSFSLVAILYKWTRNLTVSNTAILFFAFLVFNVIWFAVMHLSGMVEYFTKINPEGRNIGGLLASPFDNSTNVSDVVGMLVTVVLGCIGAVLVISSSLVRRKPPRTDVFVGELMAYTFIPFCAVVAVLVKSYDIPFPEALMFASFDAALRCAFYVMMQFSGIIDKNIDMFGVAFYANNAGTCETFEPSTRTLVEIKKTT